MGKKGGSKAPKAPDPYETASADAQFNRIDTFGPDGSGVRHGYTDANGNFVQGVAPDGFQSAQMYQESAGQRELREFMEPASLDFTKKIFSDNMDGMPDPARVRDRPDVAQDIFDRNYSLMERKFENENDRLLTNLQARGIPVGSEAFSDAYESQQDSVNDALSRLSMDANIAAGNEQSREFGLAQAERSNALNELIGAMTGQYSQPSSTPSGQAANVDIAGLIGQDYQSKLSAQQAASANRSANLGTIGSLGAAMIMKSDRRLKTDVVEVGRVGPLTLYEYRYIWDRAGTKRRGYMAQEVASVIPWAVKKIGEFLALDYSMLPEVDHV